MEKDLKLTGRYRSRFRWAARTTSFHLKVKSLCWHLSKVFSSFLSRIKASSRKQFLDNFGSLQKDEQPLRLIKDIDGDAAELIVDGLVPDTEYTFQVLSVDAAVEVKAKRKFQEQTGMRGFRMQTGRSWPVMTYISLPLFYQSLPVEVSVRTKVSVPPNMEPPVFYGRGDGKSTLIVALRRVISVMDLILEDKADG